MDTIEPMTEPAIPPITNNHPLFIVHRNRSNYKNFAHFVYPYLLLMIIEVINTEK